MTDTAPKYTEADYQQVRQDMREAQLVLRPLIAALMLPQAGDTVSTVDINWMGRWQRDHVTVTRRQAIGIERVVRACLPDTAARHVEAIEVKNLDMTACGRNVWVTIETGYRGDEGILGSIFCRERLHCCVGPRGGLTTYGSKKRGGKRVRLTGSDALIWGKDRR